MHMNFCHSTKSILPSLQPNTRRSLAHLPLVVSADRQTTHFLFQEAEEPDLFLHEV